MIRGVAGSNRLIGEHNGFEPGAADFVDRQGGDRGRQSGRERGLPRRRLADAGRQHAAHDDFVDVGRPNSRPADRFTNCRRAELRRCQCGSAPRYFPMGVRQPAMT